jgi:membrane protease subunit HflK
MEQIMRNMRKILIEPSTGSGAVPYLPLNELLRQQPATAPAPAPSSVDSSSTGGTSQ